MIQPYEVWQQYLENGECIRATEITEEQNYNMIDGNANNRAPRKSVFFLITRDTKMIGEALKYLRVFNDLTMKELGQKLDLSQSYISELECGKKQPTIQIIEK